MDSDDSPQQVPPDGDERASGVAVKALRAEAEAARADARAKRAEAAAARAEAEAARAEAEAEDTEAAGENAAEAGNEPNTPEPSQDHAAPAADQPDTESADAGEASAEQPRRRLPARLRRLRLPHSRKGRLLAACVVVVLLGAAGGTYAWYQATELPDGVAFRANDRDVTEDDLGRYGDTMRALYGVQPPKDAAKLDAFRRDLAKAYAFGIVVEQQARQQHIVIAEKTAQDVLGQFITKQFGEGSTARDKFIELLGAVGTNERAVLDEIQRQLALAQLFNGVTDDVVVTEPEVRKAFEERKDVLGQPESRTLQNIVVADRSAAESVLAELRDGASFVHVAAQSSLDDSTKNKGGNLGEVTRDRLETAYAAAAFEAKVGEVFGPVQTTHGWNVGRVVDAVPGKPATYRVAHDQLKEALGLEKAVKTWRAWLTERIDAADIEYADTYRPRKPKDVPESGPGAPQPSLNPPSPSGGG